MKLSKIGVVAVRSTTHPLDPLIVCSSHVGLYAELEPDDGIEESVQLMQAKAETLVEKHVPSFCTALLAHRGARGKKPTADTLEDEIRNQQSIVKSMTAKKKRAVQ